ncbi:MAG: hypothetical protein ACI9FN_002693 [Saprospiraceae bacterium]|jgi:hypothetical protein
MNLSEQHIKAILKETKSEYINDFDLESGILNSIENLKEYDSLLDQSKKRARIGLRTCSFLFILLIVSIFYSLKNMKNQVLNESEMLIPSVISIIMILILFVLLEGSKGLSIRKDKS